MEVSVGLKIRISVRHKLSSAPAARAAADIADSSNAMFSYISAITATGSPVRSSTTDP